MESYSGLSDSQSNLFGHVPCIQDAVNSDFLTEKPEKQDSIPLPFIVENLVPDSSSLCKVSRELGMDPILIQASSQSAAPRDSVIWCNFVPRCTADERYTMSYTK